MNKDQNVRRNFSYDKLEDMDIHNFLQSLPQRQISKHIRIALRLYMSQLNQGNINYGGLRHRTHSEDALNSQTDKSRDKENQSNDDNGDYINLNVDNLGK